MRCGGPLRPVGTGWVCETHGEVVPLQVLSPVVGSDVDTVALQSRVAVWQLSRPPLAWTLGGIAVADDERGTVGVGMLWSGPSPLGGSADLAIVAEDLGTGLGAHYAGLPGLDAGDCVQGRPDDHVEIGGHPVALWRCPEGPDDRAVAVGEADGAWLWLVCWPANADALLAERLVLVDARERPVPQDLGGLSPRFQLG